MNGSRTAGLMLAVLISLLSFSECCAQEFLFEWGQAGSGDGQFNSPSGIAVDTTGSVYVADTGNHRVQKFDDQGAFLLKWGATGGGAGQFNSPIGVAVDSLNNVYVVDSGNQRIQKFSSNGNFITAWGSAGSGPGQFNQPAGVAVDSRDTVYVTDCGNDRVQAFDGAGVFKLEWGSTGTDYGRFSGPQAIAVWTDGEGTEVVYVGDENGRIQGFATDGTFVYGFSSTGQQDGQFNGVGGIGVFDGDLVVSDSGNHRIEELEIDGAFILKWGIFGREEGMFKRPAGIVGRDGIVYVADAENARIQAFGPVLPAIYPVDLGLGYNMSLTNTRVVEAGGAVCSFAFDTIQNVWWTSGTSMTFMGGRYSGYISGISLVLTMTHGDGQRTIFDRFDLAMETSAKAVGTRYVLERDSNGTYCASESEAVLTGSLPVVPPVTPVQGNTGLLGGNIGGGGCFIFSLSR